MAAVSNIGHLLIDQEYNRDTMNWVDQKGSWLTLDSYFSDYYELTDEELLKTIEPVLEQIGELIKNNDIAITTALSVEELSSMKVNEPEKYLEYARGNRLPAFADTIKIFTRQVNGDHFRLEAVPDYITFQQRLNRLLIPYLKKNEVFLVAGTNFTARSWYGIAPGASLYDELDSLIECGFSNWEALRTATLNPSQIGERMGCDQKWGIVKDGYLADLVFTEMNPLVCIEILREPKMVMKSGILYNSEDLETLRK